MIVNYANLIKKVKGTSVPKPLSGTLSGHAAGEPFDKHVYKEIYKNHSQIIHSGSTNI
jgi:type II restriction enzyme